MGGKIARLFELFEPLRIGASESLQSVDSPSWEKPPDPISLVLVVAAFVGDAKLLETGLEEHDRRIIAEDESTGEALDRTPRWETNDPSRIAQCVLSHQGAIRPHPRAVSSPFGKGVDVRKGLAGLRVNNRDLECAPLEHASDGQSLARLVSLGADGARTAGQEREDQ